MPPRLPLRTLFSSIASSSRLPSPVHLHPSTTAIPPPTLLSLRQFHASRPHHYSAPGNHPPQDHEIPFTMIQFVDPVTHSLSPPQLLSNLLSSTDLTTHTLLLVSSDPPIVRLTNRAEHEQRLKDSSLKSHLRDRSKAEDKEVQISWTSAAGDLEHKIGLAKSMLSRGDRVSVLFAIKGSPRRDKMSAEEKAEMVERVREGILEVGRKWQDDLVKGKAVALHFEPKEEVREVVVAKVKDRVFEEKKEKEERKEARRRKDEERRLASARKG